MVINIHDCLWYPSSNLDSFSLQLYFHRNYFFIIFVSVCIKLFKVWRPCCTREILIFFVFSSSKSIKLLLFFYFTKRRICSNIPEFHLLTLKMEGVKEVGLWPRRSKAKQKTYENENCGIVKWNATSHYVIKKTLYPE